MVRVKICGLTQSADVTAACAAGADALGFVFYAPSPRALSPAQAKALLQAVAPLTISVGLFVDPSEAEVEKTLREAPVQLLQFHGDEPEAFCQRWDRPYIKALRMAPELDVAAAMAAYPSAAGFLLDAYEAGVPGGTGRVFSWDRVPAQAPAPIILAGGLTPDNVSCAIAAARPYGVDVSGGVERAKGIKDEAKVRAFIRAAKTDRSTHDAS